MFAANEPTQQHFFPSCFQFTILRLLALALLSCAWVIVLVFPCLRFTYHVPILLRGSFFSQTEIFLYYY